VYFINQLQYNHDQHHEDTFRSSVQMKVDMIGMHKNLFIFISVLFGSFLESRLNISAYIIKPLTNLDYLDKTSTSFVLFN
jgi:hypothetical protein